MTADGSVIIMHNVSTLNAGELDCAVAKAEGLDYKAKNGHCYLRDATTPKNGYTEFYSPSKHWRFGGPIIEREQLSLRHENGEWFSESALGAHWARRTGSSPLVAAMRAYVAAKIGAQIGL